MRRSICTSEPSLVYAGQKATWKFAYTTAQSLPKGTKLRFDLLSQGRSFDWQIPETNLKEKQNIIWALLPNGKHIEAKKIEPPQNPTAIFDFVLPIEVKTGETIVISMGVPSVSREEQEKGALERRRISREDALSTSTSTLRGKAIFAIRKLSPSTSRAISSTISASSPLPSSPKTGASTSWSALKIASTTSLVTHLKGL